MATSTSNPQGSGPINPDNAITWEHIEDISNPIPQASGLIDPDNKTTWEHVEETPTPTSQASGPFDHSESDCYSDSEVIWEYSEDAASSYLESDYESDMDELPSLLNPGKESDSYISWQDMPLMTLLLHVLAVLIMWLLWLLFLLTTLRRQLRLLEQNGIALW